LIDSKSRKDFVIYGRHYINIGFSAGEYDLICSANNINICQGDSWGQY
jgi:hypothetical protein